MKYFKGSWEAVATFAIPTLFILALILLPFYDRRPEKRSLKRPIAMGLASLTVVGVVTLTILAMQISLITLFASPEHGKKLYAEQNCASCHAIDGKGDTEEGPDLTHVGGQKNANYIFEHFKNPQAFVKDSEMPAPELGEKNLKDLTAYMESLK